MSPDEPKQEPKQEPKAGRAAAALSTRVDRAHLDFWPCASVLKRFAAPQSSVRRCMRAAPVAVSVFGAGVVYP